MEELQAFVQTREMLERERSFGAEKNLSLRRVKHCGVTPGEGDRGQTRLPTRTSDLGLNPSWYAPWCTAAALPHYA